MLKMIPMAASHARVPEDRRAELLADLRNNDPSIMRRIFRSYLGYLSRGEAPAKRLCAAGVPAWIVHAEKGDGGLTAAERSTLEECPHMSVITIPGTSYFIPNEEPERVAACLVEALGQAG
jgi:pimeloyl-ACP methyl ester carboxylesterase